MQKTHRIETVEEYNADGKLIRKTVTEEDEEWTEDQPRQCPSDCPGSPSHQLTEKLTRQYSTYPYTNPCEYGPSDSASIHGYGSSEGTVTARNQTQI